MNRLAIFMLALMVATPALADVYRWTDAQGRVHYSDQPPPRNIKQLKRINTPAAPEDDTSAATRPPVVLFSGDCGATCTQAADYLRQRGVPFTLKNASSDQKVAEELKQRTGALQVPVLFVGESMQSGYSPTIWNKMLEMAGYAAPPAPDAKPKAAPMPGDMLQRRHGD
jgi:glutaredoxin